MHVRTFVNGWGLFGLASLLMAGCTVGVRRDFSRTPPNEVVFEDKCSLQDYFDDMARGLESPPTLLRSDEIQLVDSDKSLGGHSAYHFADNTSLKAFRRLLGENWKPLPEEIAQAREIDLEVRWCEKVGTRWVVNDDKVQLSGGGKMVTMAPHPCLTSFLFGKELYDRRREVLGLPPIAPPATAARPAGPEPL